MNIVNKLTLRHMYLNKKRTIVTMIAIIIAVAMITAVSIVGYSIINYFGEIEMETDGHFQVKFENYAYGDNDRIIEELEADDYCIAKFCGNYVVGENGKITPYDPKKIDKQGMNLAVQILAVNDKYYDVLKIKLEEGRLPENDREIVLSRNDVIGDGEVKIGEKIAVAGKDYEIVGFTKGYDFDTRNIELDGCKIYPVWTYSGDKIESTDIVNGYFYSKGIPNDYEEIVENIEAQLRNNSYSAKAIYHSNVLAYYGLSKYDNINNVMFTMKIILFVIIVIGAVALISNGFAISIAERTRYLGMLSSVGATRKQKRMSVYFEGVVEGVVGIVFGIIAGIVGISITFKCIQPIFDETIKMEARLTTIVNVEVIIVTIIISSITIAISAYIPARRASKITAIDAIRQTKDVKITGKTVKTSFITRKLFGFEGELALKNLKRNKKRYRVTIFSLFISLTLFLTVYSYVSFVRDQFENLIDSNINYDVALWVRKNEIQNGNTEIVDDKAKMSAIFDILEKSEYVEDGMLVKEIEIRENGYTFVGFAYRKTLMHNLNSDFKKFIEEYDTIPGVDQYIGIDFFEIDEASMKQYLEENGYLYDAFIKSDNNVVIVNNIRETSYKDKEKIYKYDGKVFDDSIEGHEISIRMNGINVHYDLDNSSDEEELETTKDFKFNVFALIDAPYFGGKIASNSLTIFVTPGALAGKNYVVNDEIYYALVNDNDKFEKELEGIRQNMNIEEDNFWVKNIYEERKEMKNVFTIIAVFVYGFIILMTLICVANIFNTITTGFALRNREFAMLKSVGMTEKSFHKMIAYESAFYGLKALLFGLPLSTVIIIYMRSTITEGLALKVGWPIEGYLIAIVGVFITIGITMLYSARKVRKQNVIEALKEENI